MWTALMAATSGLLNFAMDRSPQQGEGEEVNGEQVERKARDQQYLEFVRTGISGLGFMMGVVGIWGDGAGRK
jgi:autophagy-related protein 33